MKNVKPSPDTASIRPTKSVQRTAGSDSSKQVRTSQGSSKKVPTVLQTPTNPVKNVTPRPPVPDGRGSKQSGEHKDRRPNPKPGKKQAVAEIPPAEARKLSAEPEPKRTSPEKKKRSDDAPKMEKKKQSDDATKKERKKQSDDASKMEKKKQSDDASKMENTQADSKSAKRIDEFRTTKSIRSKKYKKKIIENIEGQEIADRITQSRYMSESYNQNQEWDPKVRQPPGWFFQTWLLFQKNVQTKQRQDKMEIFFEIVVPMILLGVSVYVVYEFGPKSFGMDVETGKGYKNILPYSTSIHLHIVPDNVFARGFVKTLETITSAHNLTASFSYYSSKRKLETAYATKYSTINLALILPSTMPAVGDLFKYEIRVRPTQRIPYPVELYGDLSNCRGSANDCPVEGYVSTKVLGVQSLVEQAVLTDGLRRSGSMNEKVLLTVNMRNFPKRKYIGKLDILLRLFVILLAVASLTILINNMLVLMVTEKTNKVKDGLRMAGVMESAYWCSWFLLYGVIVSIIASIFTVVYHFFITKEGAPMILFFLFFLFGVSVIAFAFALTPIFHKPKTAAVVGSALIQFAALLFTVQTFFDNVSRRLLPLKLLSSFAFSTGLNQVLTSENQGGAQWGNLLIDNDAEDVLTSLIFLAFDTALYVLVGFYLEAVLPDEFGVRRLPPFLFWPKPSKLAKQEDKEEDFPEIYIIEPIDEELEGREAIKIRNIRKTYTSCWSKKKIDAIRGISLDIYPDQITAVLGRNGAGKSTLFNMLIGFLKPTGGSAEIFGLDTRDPADAITLRRMLGACLQYDVHFSALTVEEHLEFYGKLRGLTAEEARLETNKLLPKLSLFENRYLRADKLSGGQKRKLSVGIALIGDPPFILLDEPSAGLDPVSRRKLWDLLDKRKEGKVILLTTHFMDEADSLADRKAIIHEGLLCCAGSSSFLKNRYGCGYTLTLELARRGKDTLASDVIIERWIPEALKTRKQIAREVKYSLPLQESGKFSQLMADLEAEVAKGGHLKGFGVSLTTLEDVFLRIANDLNLSETDVKTVEKMDHSDEVDLLHEDMSLKPSCFKTMRALISLRIRRLTRSVQYIVWIFILPLVLSACGFYAAANVFQRTAHLDIEMLRGMYKSDVRIAVQGNAYGFYSNLKNQSIESFDGYTGAFDGLLLINPGMGLMAAVKIVSIDEPDNTTGVGAYHMKADISVNGSFFHSPPLVLNLLSKFFASVITPKLSSPMLMKTSYRYEPFGRFEGLTSVELRLSFVAVVILGMAFVLSCTGLVMEIVRDRELKVRNQLRVNGVSTGVYFLTFFVPFGFMMLLVLVGQLCLIFAFRVEAFVKPYALIVLAGLLCVCIIPSMLFSAILSCFFSRVQTVEVIYPTISFWAGIIAMLATTALDGQVQDFGDDSEERTAPISLHIALCALNIFYVPYAIPYWILKTYLDAIALRNQEGDVITFYTFRTTEIIAMLACMLIQIPVFLFILIVADVFTSTGDPMTAFEALIVRKPRVSIDATNVEGQISTLPNYGVMDEEVVAERQRAREYFTLNQGDEKVVVAIHDLEKVYLHGRQFRRVANGIHLLVEKGEVFGLLGHNGAGKTTLIKLLVAEESADAGKIQLCGQDVRVNSTEAFRNLGYCPQHDALWDNVTLKEHIALYAAIRGVRARMRPVLTSRFLQGLGIIQHADKYPEQLSGGTKRKLSYAISMAGAPKVVLMDEPSTGMDPQSRRFLWNTILGSFKETKGAILTTHSMEEADILCTRIGIMVRGTLLCLGSPQHLKNKYGKGYTLEIKLKKKVGDSSSESSSERSGSGEDDEDDASENASTGSRVILFGAAGREIPNDFKFIARYFPHCRMIDTYGACAIFNVPNEDIVSVSKTFAMLEELKTFHNVEEYSFSQATLEQVFLSFAKYSEDKDPYVV